MAQSVSLTVESPSFTNDVAPSILPPFGHHRRFASQAHKKRKTPFCTNTLPHRIKKESKNQSTLKTQADVIRYIPSKKGDEDARGELHHNLFFQNAFSPGVHSTPIYRNRNETNALEKATSSCSLNAKTNSQSSHPSSLSSNIYLNDYDLFKSTVKTGVPSVSKKVDIERQAVISTASVGIESKIIKRRGICGVSWILRLALKDTSIGKIYRKQIGWIILILFIFVLMGGLLIHFSSQISLSFPLVTYTNYTQVPPKIVLNQNISTNVTHKHYKIVLNQNMSTYVSITTTPEPMYSEDANRAILTYSVSIVNDLPGEHFTLMTNISDNKTSIKKANIKTELITPNNTGKYEGTMLVTNELTESCKGCRKGFEVCIAVAGVPVCKPAADVDDPTGCGGLCALEIEACRLLNKEHLIYTCHPLETLQPCKADQWRCENQLCISKSKHCDGHYDCYDKSDEIDCFCDLDKGFHCGKNTSCIDNSKRCDGIVDCWDGTDELNCTIVCLDDKFTCNNKECIQESLFCDGVADCADKTDEPAGCGGPCETYEFKCTNKRCIHRSKVCNEVDNCGDLSDEFNCPNVRPS